MKPCHKILYITYDGVMEPIGQSQVLSYLLKLAVDHNITLVSYESLSKSAGENILIRT